MIIRSLWRGDPRNTSAPNRAMSNRDALIDIISIAQQASPKAIGHIEFFLPQLMTLSSVVVTTPARNAACSTVSLSIRENSSGGPLAIGSLICLTTSILTRIGDCFSIRRAASVALICLALLPRYGLSQTPDAPVFETASVRRSAHLAGPDFRGPIVMRPGRLSARNVTLGELIAIAWRVERWQVLGGPGWLGSDEFDVEAKAGDSAASDLALMLRTLLAQRFHLLVRSEIKEFRGYALIVNGRGPRIHSAGDPGARARCGPEIFHCSMHDFANFLSVQLSIPPTNDPATPSRAPDAPAPVQDRTSLEGVYDFRVDLKPELGADSFVLWQRALEDQLGLKLQAGKIQAECLVVDRVERTPTDN